MVRVRFIREKQEKIQSEYDLSQIVAQHIEIYKTYN